MAVQILHIQAVFSPPACPVLHRYAFLVVSEWCQRHGRIPLALV
jgi:hypothetical protein